MIVRDASGQRPREAGNWPRRSRGRDRKRKARLSMPFSSLPGLVGPFPMQLAAAGSPRRRRSLTVLLFLYCGGGSFLPEPTRRDEASRGLSPDPKDRDHPAYDRFGREEAPPSVTSSGRCSKLVLSLHLAVSPPAPARRPRRQAACHPRLPLTTAYGASLSPCIVFDITSAEWAPDGRECVRAFH